MKNLLYIGNKLSKHGFSVTTIETLGPLLEAEGFSIRYSSENRNKLLRLLDMLWSVVSQRKNIDFILIDTYSTSNFWYAFFVSQLARLLQLNYIPILHGGNLPNRLKNSQLASTMLFKNAYKNVSASEFLLEEFVSKGFLNTVYIPNSVQLENYNFKQRFQVVPNLLWVRSFAKIYNPLMAIKVFKLVKEHFPEATLCMVGPDKDGTLNEARALAKIYNLDVKFTGKLSKLEWLSLSENYDVFINTTHFDNFPVSVLEAMALGFPIVSTNVGGLPFLLEHNHDSILVEDNDSESMAKSIAMLYENPQLAAILSQNARAKSIEFDWIEVKKNWKEILK